MHVEPGYYWVRWPNDEEEAFRHWKLCCVENSIFDSEVRLVDDADARYSIYYTYSLEDAEISPRIEPPDESAYEDRSRGSSMH